MFLDSLSIRAIRNPEISPIITSSSNRLYCVRSNFNASSAELATSTSYPSFSKLKRRISHKSSSSSTTSNRNLVFIILLNCYCKVIRIILQRQKGYVTILFQEEINIFYSKRIDFTGEILDISKLGNTNTAMAITIVARLIQRMCHQFIIIGT